ncbi:MAG TPA: hypothetical protein PKO19_13405, partial [Chitinophagales bacterium]|nr:hypothetical protein [Chitinophagales bacterium]
LLGEASSPTRLLGEASSPSHPLLSPFSSLLRQSIYVFQYMLFFNRIITFPHPCAKIFMFFKKEVLTLPQNPPQNVY